MPIGDLHQSSTATQYMIYGALFILSSMYVHYQAGIDRGHQQAQQEESRLVLYYKGLRRMYGSEAQAGSRELGDPAVTFINRFLIAFFAVSILLTLPLSFVVHK